MAKAFNIKKVDEDTFRITNGGEESLVKSGSFLDFNEMHGIIIYEGHTYLVPKRYLLEIEQESDGSVNMYVEYEDIPVGSSQ